MQWICVFRLPKEIKVGYNIITCNFYKGLIIVTPNLIVTHTENLVKISESMQLPEINEYVNEKLAKNKELDDKREAANSFHSFPGSEIFRAQKTS